MQSATLKLKKISAVWLVAMMALAALGGSVQAQSATVNPEAANKALAWVKTQQQPDGSFAGFGAGSTVDVVLAILAAGQDPNTYTQGGNTPVTFLEGKAADLSKTPGGAGKLLLAASGLAQQSKTFAATKTLVDAINASYDLDTGHYGKDAIGHAFAMLGLASSMGNVPAKAVDYMRSVQTPEGGWAFSGDTKAGGADTNTTAVAIQALIAAGVDKAGPEMKKAQAYLAGQQNEDGGFPYQKGAETGSDSDVNSTSYVAQALIAMGADASRPVAFLRSMQKPNGAFQWMKSDSSDNAGATYQAIPAILGVTLVAHAVGGPVPVQNTGGTNPSAQPGMPSTGDSTSVVVLVMLATLAALTLGVGIATRRKSVVG